MLAVARLLRLRVSLVVRLVGRPWPTLRPGAAGPVPPSAPGARRPAAGRAAARAPVLAGWRCAPRCRGRATIASNSLSETCVGSGRRGDRAAAAARLGRRDVDRPAADRRPRRPAGSRARCEDPALARAVDRLAVLPVREHRRGDEDRRVGAGDRADDQREGEVLERVAAEEEQREHGQDRAEATSPSSAR